MSERANLVRLFKAVDDAARLRSGDELAPLAQVLPQYKDGGAIGWFDRFAEHDPSFSADIVGVDEAL